MVKNSYMTMYDVDQDFQPLQECQTANVPGSQSLRMILNQNHRMDVFATPEERANSPAAGVDRACLSILISSFAGRSGAAIYAIDGRRPARLIGRCVRVEARLNHSRGAQGRIPALAAAINSSEWDPAKNRHAPSPLPAPARPRGSSEGVTSSQLPRGTVG